MNAVEDYLLSIIRPMLKKGTFGGLVIKIKDGKIIHIDETKGHQPPVYVKKG